nr:hypothetical protein [Pannonibacter phragmitetus]
MPREMGMEFDPLFAHVAADGYRGVNVTYPYKERAAAKVQVDDPLVRAIGAVNTVIFEDGKARGFNTDYSGFIAAYRAVRGDAAPGPVLMIGQGASARRLPSASSHWALPKSALPTGMWPRPMRWPKR